MAAPTSGDEEVTLDLIEEVTEGTTTSTSGSQVPLSSTSSGAGYGLTVSGLATYMPTGTIAAFLVLTQIMADGGQCKHSTDTAGRFVKANDKAEVTLMALVIWLLGIACFVSSFVKTKKDPSVPGHVTYTFISVNQLRGHDPGAHNADGSLKWCAGWKVWVHAVFSTLAYATWSLTSTSATSCFYSLPAAVSRSLSPIVAVICAIAFTFLGPPAAEDAFSFPSVDQKKVHAIKTAFRHVETLLDERVYKQPVEVTDHAFVPAPDAPVGAQVDPSKPKDVPSATSNGQTGVHTPLL